MTPRNAIVAAGAVALLGLTGCTGLPVDTSEPTSAATPSGSAAKLLKHLKVAGADDHGHKYDRDDFGEPWADVDHNGCDTRDDVLARDMRGEKVDSDHCTVLSGELKDRYTGKEIDFRRGRTSSMKVQIDHVYPLHAAWLHGAWKWSDDKRERIANDLGNLLAVDGPANNDKSDATPSDWKPSRHGEWCDYATRYVKVADHYDLTVSRADKLALTSMLGRCG